MGVLNRLKNDESFLLIYHSKIFQLLKKVSVLQFWGEMSTFTNQPRTFKWGLNSSFSGETVIRSFYVTFYFLSFCISISVQTFISISVNHWGFFVSKKRMPKKSKRFFALFVFYNLVFVISFTYFIMKIENYTFFII